MRILFAVDSFFQLIEATNLRLTLYKDEIADIAIYASTPNAKLIRENLSNSGLFSNCYFLDTPLIRCGAKYTFKEKLPKYFIYAYTMVNPKGYAIQGLGFSDVMYDTFLFSGNGALPECIFNAIRKVNKDIRCIRFEDSYVSYTREYGKVKGGFRLALEKFMYKIFGGARIEEYIDGYYFAEPELVQVKFNYPVIQAPKINRGNRELIEVLNEVFKFSELQDSYDEKFVFFESGDSFFEKNNEDVEFIKELIGLVGEDSVLIKRHPRCVENRFEKLGVHIAKGLPIPWELIQLNINMDQKVFITTTSAAALSSAVYFGDDSKSILLFEGMENKPSSVTDVMRKYMKAFQEKYGFNVLYMPKNMDEFKKIIEEEI